MSLSDGYILIFNLINIYISSLSNSNCRRFFRSLCIASKVDKAIELAKEALEDGNCCVIGLQSTGEARAKGAALVSGMGDSGGDFADFVSAPNEDLKRIIMMLFPLPPKPAGILAPVFLNNAVKDDNVEEEEEEEDDDNDVTVDNDVCSRYKIGATVSKVFVDEEIGEERPFSGNVIGYDKEENLYKIKYEDGDEEEINEVDLSKIIDDEGSGKRQAKTSNKLQGKRKGKKKSCTLDSDSDTDFNMASGNDDDDDDDESFNGDSEEDDESLKGVIDEVESDDGVAIQGKRSKSNRVDRNPKSKKRSKSSKNKKIRWDEIDLNLDVTASVENERLVNYRRAVEKIKQVSLLMLLLFSPNLDGILSISLLRQYASILMRSIILSSQPTPSTVSSMNSEAQTRLLN